MSPFWRQSNCERGVTASIVDSLAVIGLFLLVLSCLLATRPVVAADDFEPRPAPELLSLIAPEVNRVSEQDPESKAWSLYQTDTLVGYAFESIDLVQLPGFAGEPMNLLIRLDPDGRFVDVVVVEHHEPIFLHGLPQDSMQKFLDQYAGHVVNERFIVGKGSGGAGDTVMLDGVTKATVSVIVLNDIVLASATAVARQKIASMSRAPAAKLRSDVYEKLSWQQLLDRGLVKRWTLDAAMVSQEMGRDLNDYESLSDVDFDSEPFSEVYFAHVNSPIVGRNLLGDEDYELLISRLKGDAQAIAIMSRGAFSYIEPEFRPGTVPRRVGITQHEQAVNMRDLHLYHFNDRELIEGAPALDNLRLFNIKGVAGFDPGSPWSLDLSVDLRVNHLLGERASFSESYQLPEALVTRPVVVPRDTRPAWMKMWEQRTGIVIITSIALLILTVVFFLQRRLVDDHAWLLWFRRGFLAFTLLFIGLYAQGQLSVVNIFTVLLAIRDGFRLEMFLLDPVLFILWSFTFVSLFIFGRGVFCGWLCPFGVLQDCIGWLANKLRIKQWRISNPVHRRLQWIKYVILAVLVVVAFVSLSDAERLAEVEPFKTSVTLFFVREPAFVIYALVLLGLGLFVHKFYCRYVCPLGAGLAVLGRFRLLSWLDRREECGSPCQTCRKRCEIDAIEPSGKIDYNECIQCLDCVAILQDHTQCAPEMLTRKRAAKESVMVFRPVGG